MDRRSFIAIGVFTLLFLAVNWYFETQNQESLKQWKVQQEAVQAKKAEEVKKQISTRTAALDSLPVSDHAVTVKENKLVMGSNLPEEQDGAKKTFSNSSFAVYGSTPLLIGDLPLLGTYDVQLYFPETKKVVLGSFENGELKLPIEELGQKVAGMAIVFYKTEGQYLPVATWNEGKLSLLQEVPNLKTIRIAKSESSKLNEKGVEKFYVIQNDYQQLVFSNFGGALKEINLPFRTPQNNKSVVKEIEFDREMIAQNPQNARFPAVSYMTPDGKSHDQGVLGGFYPLIRRDLIEKSGKKSVYTTPRYYALNIVSDYPEMAETEYKVIKFTDNEIVFESETFNRKITKSFSVEAESKGGPYTLNLDLKIEGDNRGLWLSSGIPEVEWISGSPSPSLKYRITRNGKPDVENIDLPQDTLTVTSTRADWICNSNGFLGMILDPLSNPSDGYRAQIIPGQTVPSRLVEIDAQNNRFTAASLPGYQLNVPIKPGNQTLNFRVFAGPFATEILKTVDKTYSDPATGYTPDYIACQTFHGWFSFISEPFAKFLLILLQFFYWITHSWGFSIILLTVALRVMLYPLNAWSLKSTISMQKIAPEITKIQEKHKKDPKKAQLEIVNLYRERKVNPLSGCLPLLIQMPFLIGMFDLLKSTFELRGASFIPGWIDNLAAPDVLFSWSYPIPFIGNQFHLLPILLGVVMFFQQKLMSPGATDPNAMTDQQRQQKAMGTVMTVVFTFMFYNFPSGLNIYWLSSMLLGILQQWWTSKRMNGAPVKASVPVKR